MMIAICKIKLKQEYHRKPKIGRVAFTNTTLIYVIYNKLECVYSQLIWKR